MHEDLIKQLRYCANSDPVCKTASVCPYYDQTEEETHDYRCVERLMEQAADAIEELQKAENFHKFNSEFWEGKYNSLADEKWISVTERLPEKEDEAVIVLEKQGFALIDWRHDNKWAILDNNYGIATHWMPIPPPPMDGE